MTAAVLSVAIAGAMWWSYFDRSKQELEHALVSVEGRDRSMLARDAYSLLHFPMMLGIVAFAAAVEHALAHAEDPLGLAARSLLASSVLLFAGGMGAALLRAGRPVPMVRILAPLTTAIVVFALPAVPALVSLAIVLVGLTILAILEGDLRGTAGHG